MKMIITLTLFVITFVLSIFGLGKGVNNNSLFKQKHQIINVKTNTIVNNETKK